MMWLLERVVLAAEAVISLFGRIAAYSCVALVLLVAGNVLARYFFRAGTMWLQELEWHLISPIAMLGVAYGLLRGAQVRVDVLYDRFPLRTQLVIDLFASLCLILFATVLLKLSYTFTMQSYMQGESSPNPGGLDHRFLLKSFLPLGFFLLALQGLCQTFRSSVALYQASRRTE